MSDFPRGVLDRERNEQSGVDALILSIVYHEPFEDEHVSMRGGVREMMIDEG
jgi:hypothetical protein